MKDNDPFLAEGTFTPQKKGPANLNWQNIWARLTPQEMSLCKALGDRLCRIVVDRIKGEPAGKYAPPHPLTAAAEIAAAHLLRPLDLIQFYRASDDDALNEYIQIARHLDRINFQFAPATVAPLRFEAKLSLAQRIRLMFN